MRAWSVGAVTAADLTDGGAKTSDWQ